MLQNENEVPNPKATVIMFHGVGGNGRLLSCIAIPLVKNGFEVICPDLPLYGYTEFDGKVDYQSWVKCGSEIVKHYQKNGFPKTFVFGLSAGGMLAYQVASECESISGVLASCILDQRDIDVTKQTATSPLIATIGKPLMRISQKVIGDIKVPIRFIYSMLTPEIKVEPEQFRSCPFLLVHPGDDRWTDISLSRKFYDRLACEKETLILEGAGHFPIEELGLGQMEEGCVRFLNKHVQHLKNT